MKRLFYFGILIFVSSLLLISCDCSIIQIQLEQNPNKKLKIIQINTSSPGNSGIISIDSMNFGAGTIKLSWIKAVDNITAQEEILYKVYHSDMRTPLQMR